MVSGRGECVGREYYSTASGMVGVVGKSKKVLSARIHVSRTLIARAALRITSTDTDP